jgi:trimethylamine--corrinoid protein Co-methyltransferase
MVIDDDIYGRMLRLAGGIQVDEEALAIEVIRSVGPRRHFLEEPHTVRHLRSEFRRSQLADRQNPEVWLREGGRDAAEAAAERVRSILGKEVKHYLDPSGEAALAELFEASVRSANVHFS